MRKLLGDVPAYLQIMALWPQMAYAYRINLVADILTVVLQVFLLKVVWTAVYAGQSSVDGVSLNTLITFLTLANLQSWLTGPVIAGFMREWIRDGSISLHLARPVGFIGQVFAHQVGATLALLPFVVLAFPLAATLGGMQPPASLGAGLLYLVSLALAYLISTLFGLLLGLVAFWTLEINGILVIHRFLAQFFSGALVFGRIQQLDWIIRQGEFDRYLVRQLSPFLLLMSERLQVNAFGDLLGGVALFVAANSLVGVDWSPAALAYLLVAVVGGCLLEASLKLCVAALAFRFLQTGNLVFFVDQMFNNFGNYPLKIFSGAVEFFLTFAFPLAFVAYFPATVLLNRTQELGVSPLFADLAPLAGALWFGIAYVVWTREIAQYQSSGH